MPPKGAPLTAVEIGKLRAWIDQGAKWPKALVIATGDKHWSFQPVKRPAPPAVKNATWLRNDIDRFVVARLESAGVAPSPEAPRHRSPPPPQPRPYRPAAGARGNRRFPQG